MAFDLYQVFDMYQLFKWTACTKTPSRESIGSIQETNRSGRLFAVELEKARQECKSKVARISKDCRANNRMFRCASSLVVRVRIIDFTRDTEFDIEDDREQCLHGLSAPESERFMPSDVQRVSQIFDDPQFFLEDSHSNGVMKGRWAHWWFLSALTSVAAASLLETFCVAASIGSLYRCLHSVNIAPQRDEEVGVYGFVFHRDAGWVVVIIDE